MVCWAIFCDHSIRSLTNGQECQLIQVLSFSDDDFVILLKVSVTVYIPNEKAMSQDCSGPCNPISVVAVLCQHYLDQDRG